MNDLLTTVEAAQMLRCSKQSIYRWHKSGLLNGFTPQGTKKLLFRREDIMRFLYRNAAPSAWAQTGARDVAEFRAENPPKRK